MTQLQSESVASIAGALVKAQAALLPAVKSAENPHLKSKFADLKSIISAAREPLEANGLSVVQRNHPNDKGIHLQTTVYHDSGEWISDAGLFLPAAKLAPQEFGSALTYARRYGYAAMLGIIQDDDDAVAAMALERSAELDVDQIRILSDLSAKAGIPEPVAAARIANMRTNDFDKGVAALEQRIAEAGAAA